MYKHLYDIFKHWYCTDGIHQNSIWLFSDPHFGDSKAQMLRKDYIGDKELIKRLNSKIGKNDTLICLGDVGDVSFIKKLKGYKILIMGNHDKGQSTYKRTYLTGHQTRTITPVAYASNDIRMEEKWEYIVDQTDNHLFDEVYEGPLIIGPKLILSHEPVNWPFGINIHGHDHPGCEIKDDLHVNLCVEHIDYTPVCLKTIVESGRLGSVDDIHRITINNRRILEK